jgi:general transcription factor IIIA
MRRHRAAHEGKELFRCGIETCGQVFRKHGTLQKHVTVVHEGKSPFICRVLDERGEECGSGFDAAGKLKSHEGRIHGGKRFWCTVCSSASTPRETDLGLEETKDGFSTYAELQDHLSVKHAPTCEACGLQCKSQRALKSHIDIAHGPLGMDERRKFACNEFGCGRTFTKRGNLNVHVRTVHAGKKFVCGGTDLNSLKNVADWDGLNACGQALSTKQSLEGHIRTAHLGLPHSRKKTDTPTAERKARKKPVSSLVRLTGAGYENESGRDISCLLPDCSFRFMRDYDLEVHLSFHHGLSNNQMESLWSESENLVARSTWDGSLTFGDLETEHALDMQFNNESGMEGVQATCQEGSMKRTDLGAEHLKEVNMDDFQGPDGQDTDMLDPMLR